MFDEEFLDNNDDTLTIEIPGYNNAAIEDKKPAKNITVASLKNTPKNEIFTVDAYKSERKSLLKHLFLIIAKS